MTITLVDLGFDKKESYTPTKEEDFPYIGLEHVEPNTLHLSSYGSSTEVNSSKYKFRKGDILFGTMRPYFRKLIIAPFDGVCSTEFCVIRPQNLDERDFLFYAMAQKIFIEYATTNSNGARPRTKWELFSDFKLGNFSKQERIKIGSILSAYDSLIENNRRRIQLLEQSARLLYREWFVHLRFPGHEHVRIIDGVPEGWEMKRLEDVCLRITDGSHWSPKTFDDGYPMASVKDMNEWGFEISECRKISEEDYEELIRNDCKPLKGDVLIAKDGSYLKHIFVIEKEIDLVILSSIAIIRPNNQILSHVLSLYLREPSVKNRMAGYVSGVALPRIVLKDFRKFLIMVPDMYLQKQFFNLAEPMIKNCHCLIEMNDNLRRAREILLPRLMNGEIAV